MFLSLSAIQWIFELGISTCMVQYISAAKNETDKSRYIYFLLFFLLVSALLLAVFLYIFSFFIFSSVSTDVWLYPWVLYLIMVAVNLFSNSFVLIEESTRDIEYAYMTKMLNAMAYSSSLIFCLYFEWGLYSLFISQLAMFLIVILRERHQISWVFSSDSNKNFLTFKRTFLEVIPFQYKLSVIWISGYLYWNAFQLIFFKYESPELAGYFGATNGVFGALAMISISLVSTQRARWGKLNETNGASKTYSLFKIEKIKGLSLYLILSLVLVLLFLYLPYPEIKVRFLPFELLVLLCIFRFFVLFQEFILIYLRTFKDEPLYKITLANYIILPLGILVGLGFDSIYMVFIISIFFQLLFSFVYYRQMMIYLNDKRSF
ncbi:hypothetical protein [Photobacterium sanguinicancri]|uniref:Polysaccharide biosynthesis protein n=1 Tax=Photobacterium sanguinicancri TaxID=875932 RepID=A0AAW7Y281_9GAMM|nr:hypothetical protein [Photobacterium sanguinicancri]MDO6542472.1 hypothetical protein [Photobacterium sanguinicancri]